MAIKWQLIEFNDTQANQRLTSRYRLKWQMMRMRMMVQVTVRFDQLRELLLLLLLHKLFVGDHFLTVLRLRPGGLSGSSVVVVDFALARRCLDPNVAFRLTGVCRLSSWGGIVGGIRWLRLILIGRTIVFLGSLSLRLHLTVGRRTVCLWRLIGRGAVAAVHLLIVWIAR